MNKYNSVDKFYMLNKLFAKTSKYNDRSIESKVRKKLNKPLDNKAA